MKKLLGLSLLLTLANPAFGIVLNTDFGDGLVRYKDKVFSEASVVKRNNIIYSPNVFDKGKALVLDLYQSNVDTELRRPVVVFIHGGGFINGNEESVKDGTIVREFVTRGYVFVSINYRHNGKSITATADAQAAIRFLRGNAKKYKIDPNRIISFGGSAGGITSQMLGIMGESATDLANQEGNTVFIRQPSWTCASISEAGGIEEMFRVPHTDSGDTATFINVHGTQDTTVGYEDAKLSMESLAQFIPFAEFITLDPIVGYPVGHMVMDEDQSKIISDFFIPALFDRVIVGDQCPAASMKYPQIAVPL